MKLQLLTSAAAAILAASPFTAAADWPAIHFNSGNNAVLGQAAIVTDVGGAPAWTTVETDHALARATIAGNQIYLPAIDDGGTGGFGETGDDSIRIRAYNTADGSVDWTSPGLDAGDSVGNGSLSSITVDGAGDLYFPSGTSVQKLDPSDGSVIWATQFDDTNTGASGPYGIVNSSVSLGGGLVYIQTTNFFSPPQVIALDPATGDVEWFTSTNGAGVTSPLYIDLGGGNEVLIVDTKVGSSPNIEAGLLALDPADGSVIWDHSTIGSPWGIAGGDFVGVNAEPVFAGGSVYVVGYDFSAASELLSIDPLTGAANWEIITIGTDTAPIVIGSSIYALGGEFGDADLKIISTVDGTETGSIDLGAGFFRNYIAGVSDGVYLTNGDELQLRDLTGAEVTASRNAADGPVTVDGDGSIYTFDDTGALVKYDSTSDVTDWLVY